MRLSKRVEALAPSATLEISAKAKELRDQGYDVIGLGAGEPDFNTPAHILEAAYEAMKAGYTKYTPTAGLVPLKEAIIKKMEQDQQLHYKLSEVIVCNGAKHALYVLFQAILDDGDEVIIPSPYWVSYPEQVRLADGVPIFVRGLEANDYKITAEQLEQAITPRTRAVIINSPSNPTGMIYTPDELLEIGNVCLKHNILIVSDEIYEKLVYDGNEHVSIAQLSPDLKDQTIVINGVSKSHSMTGWRIGYALGNELIIKAMTNLASHSTSNPTSIAQYATFAAYNDSQEEVEVMRQAFEQRLNTVYEKLIAIPGVTCVKPQGAFYLFPNVSEAAKLAGYETVDDFAKGLLEEVQVAVVPGSGFGEENNIRLSYATSLDVLEEAIVRINNFIEAKIAQVK